MQRPSYAVTIGVFLLSTASARPDFATYADRDSFLAVTQNQSTIDFEGLAPLGSYKDYGTSNGLTQQGVTFIGTTDGDSSLYVVDPAFSPSIYDWGSKAVLLGPSLDFAQVARIDINLPTGITAVGMDLMSFRWNGTDFEPVVTFLQVSLGAELPFTVQTGEYPNRAFFGVTSDAPIASISVTPTDLSYPLLDNFTFGPVVPEPASIFLLSIGGVAMVGSVLARRCRVSRETSSVRRSDDFMNSREGPAS